MAISDFQSFQQYLQQRDVLDRFGLKRIGVFGSLARGEAFRDIDLLIDDTISYKDLIALRDELQRDLTVPVDLMLHQHAEPIILRHALKDVRYVVSS